MTRKRDCRLKAVISKRLHTRKSTSEARARVLGESADVFLMLLAPSLLILLQLLMCFPPSLYQYAKSYVYRSLTQRFLDHYKIRGLYGCMEEDLPYPEAPKEPVNYTACKKYQNL